VTKIGVRALEDLCGTCYLVNIEQRQEITEIVAV